MGVVWQAHPAAHIQYYDVYAYVTGSTGAQAVLHTYNTINL